MSTAGSNTYTYDASGNLITRNGSTITWNTANLPTLIDHVSGRSSTFSYTPDGQRWRQHATYAGGTETTIYVGGLLERLTTTAGTVLHRHYIQAGSGTVVYTRASNGTERTHFITSDHLGSSSSITDSTGALVVNESFDAFGKRRGSNWTGSPSAAELSTIANVTRQGYTGHEHLDNLDLIHMNGRIQDPTIGRFLSADPFVQEPDNSQSLNRYSYVFNNPLSFTDPSGFAGSAADNIAPQARPSFIGLIINFGGTFADFLAQAIPTVEPNVSEGARPDSASQLHGQRRSPTEPVRELSELTNAERGRKFSDLPFIDRFFYYRAAIDAVGYESSTPEEVSAQVAATVGQEDVAGPAVGQLNRLGLAISKATSLSRVNRAVAATKLDVAKSTPLPTVISIVNASSASDGRPDDVNQMRLQLQTKGVNISSLALQNGSRTGVTKAQVYAGLSTLYGDVNAPDKRLGPLGKSKEFSAAIVGISQKVKASAPVSSIGNVLRNTFVYEGVVYRVDLENLRGTNLRE